MADRQITLEHLRSRNGRVRRVFAFDARVTIDGGLGYMFFKNDTHSFKGRSGPGTLREFGGSNDDWFRKWYSA